MFNKPVFFLISSFLFVGCATTNQDKVETNSVQQNAEELSAEEKVEQQKKSEEAQQIAEERAQKIALGWSFLEKKEPVSAIEQGFDRVISSCEASFEEGWIYKSARSQKETLFYLLEAANASNKEESDSKGTQVVDQNCADAYYLKGYSYIEIGNGQAAFENLNLALQMSPKNSKYLSEMAHLLQMVKEPEASMNAFLEAEKAAEFSPEDVYIKELTRAKRGIAFSFVELGELDKAEQKLNECLKLNAKDHTAQNELDYITALRQRIKAGAPGKPLATERVDVP